MVKRYANYIWNHIAEPRIQRSIQFFVYIFLGIAGAGVLLIPPVAFKNLIGIPLVYCFGGFLVIGAILGAISVLPGIYWLERVAVISSVTGILIFLILVISLRTSIVSIALSIALIGAFANRWFDIKGTLLAPIKE